LTEKLRRTWSRWLPFGENGLLGAQSEKRQSEQDSLMETKIILRMEQLQVVKWAQWFSQFGTETGTSPEICQLALSISLHWK
jgi:TATA-binding protein-associated factor Taf7